MAPDGNSFKAWGVCAPSWIHETIYLDQRIDVVETGLTTAMKTNVTLLTVDVGVIGARLVRIDGSTSEIAKGMTP
jgi:hypothetical protein